MPRWCRSVPSRPLCIRLNSCLSPLLLLQVEGLLELGAALDCKDKQGRTPLHFAAANGRTAVVRFLWSKAAEVDAETPGGCDRRTDV